MSSNRIRPLKKKNSEPIVEDITKMITAKAIGTEIDELLVQTMSLLDGKIVQIQQHITERKSNPEAIESAVALQDALNERNSSIKRNLRRILDMQSAPLALWMKPFSSSTSNPYSSYYGNINSSNSSSNSNTPADESMNTTANTYPSQQQQQLSLNQYYDQQQDDYIYEDGRLVMNSEAYDHGGIHEEQNLFGAPNLIDYYQGQQLQQQLHQIENNKNRMMMQQQQQQVVNSDHQIWQDNNPNGDAYYGEYEEMYEEEDEEQEDECMNEQIGGISVGGGGSSNGNGIPMMTPSLGVRSEEECQERLQIYLRFEKEYGIEIPKFFKCTFYLKKTPRQRFFQYMRDQEFSGVAKVYEILKTQQRVAEFLDTSVPNIKRILSRVQADIPTGKKRGPKVMIYQ